MAERSPYDAPRNPDLVPLPARRPHIHAIAWFWAAFFFIAVLMGARAAIVRTKSPGDLVFQLGLAVCLGTWAIADARQRGQPIPRSQRLWFFAFATLVVPGYVVVTRGWKGLGWVLVHAAAWMTVFAAAMVFTGILLFLLRIWRVNI